MDFDGSLEERPDGYLTAHPTATFEEVEREILAPFEGNAVIDAISPRVFEAAALGTAMVNFAGRYSDVIEPGVHYIPLEKDFSNFDEVVAQIRDDAELERLASRAHADLVASGRYSLRAFVEGFDREIEARMPQIASPAAIQVGSQAAPQARRRRAAAVAGAPGAPAAGVVGSQQRGRSHRAAPDRALPRDRGARGARRRAKSRAGGSGCCTTSFVSLRRRPRTCASCATSGRRSTCCRRLDSEASGGSPSLASLAVEARESRSGCVSARVRRDPSRNRWRRSSGTTALSKRRASPLPRFRSRPLEIGYHVVGGAHRFTALLELARRDPDGVIAALEPLFRPRPDEPVHELDPRLRILLRVVSRPRETTALWTATARAGLGDEALRKLLRAYLGSSEARADAPLHLLLKDFYRLQLIRESPTSLELEDGGTLVYRTGESGSRNGVTLDAAIVGSLERIVWDHSAVGPSVASKEHPGVSITLDGGRHTFPALTPVARRFPELALPALRWAAGVE